MIRLLRATGKMSMCAENGKLINFMLKKTSLSDITTGQHLQPLKKSPTPMPFSA